MRDTIRGTPCPAPAFTFLPLCPAARGPASRRPAFCRARTVQSILRGNPSPLLLLPFRARSVGFLFCFFVVVCFSSCPLVTLPLPPPAVHTHYAKHDARQFASTVHVTHLAYPLRICYLWAASQTAGVVAPRDVLLPGGSTPRPPAAAAAPSRAAAAGGHSRCRGGRGPGRPQQPPGQGFTVPPAALGRRGGSITITCKSRKK